MLAPCTSCRRHVRADEPQCPFCGGVVGQPTNRAVPRAPRVAILFAGAIGLAGCSASDEGSEVAMYGAPMVDSATVDTRPDASPDDTSMSSLYGGPPVDSSVSDTGAAKDSAVGDSASADAEEDTFSPVPPYGAPLLDSGSDE